MNLRTIGFAALAAVALVAGRAQAQDAGWDTKYGFVFTLPNPFSGGGNATATAPGGIAIATGGAGGNGSILNSYDGMVGFQYNLAPQNALRFGVNLSRKSEGVKEETDALGRVLKTLPTWTSQYGIGLEGQYMLRLGTASVAPYVGVGALIDFSQNNLNGDQNTTFGGPTTKYDNFERTWSLGLIATGGLEWRVHKVISLFAEYRADLTLISSTKGENKTTPPGGPTTKTTSKESHYVNLATGIAHGGQFGVIAFF